MPMMQSLKELYRIGRGPSSSHTVLKTMLETGHDLPRLYRETSVGGLSRFVRR
ncbi:MAG: hypothetical protein IJQ00_08070 [Kiritimatiellae bacterium]|nr:hypothetical protein [Kiritimatiellia bacterium]